MPSVGILQRRPRACSLKCSAKMGAEGSASGSDPLPALILSTQPTWEVRPGPPDPCGACSSLSRTIGVHTPRVSRQARCMRAWPSRMGGLPNRVVASAPPAAQTPRGNVEAQTSADETEHRPNPSPERTCSGEEPADLTLDREWTPPIVDILWRSFRSKSPSATGSFKFRW